MTRKKILDLGCGASKHTGSIGVDRLKLKGVDVVHNLDSYPYPFKTSSIDVVLAHNSIEHLEDTVSVFREVHRILKAGGKFHIEVPHFSCCDMYKDPTHKNFFSFDTVGYFVPGDPLFEFSYAPEVRFKILNRQIVFWGTKKVFDKPQEYLFNKIPHLYERKLTWLFPAYQIIFDLECIK